MDHTHHTDQGDRTTRARGFPWSLVGIAALGAGAGLLLTGHGGHAAQALPLLFLLACPLLHMLHGHGHGHGHGQGYGGHTPDPAGVRRIG